MRRLNLFIAVIVSSCLAAHVTPAPVVIGPVNRFPSSADSSNTGDLVLATSETISDTRNSLSIVVGSLEAYAARQTVSDSDIRKNGPGRKRDPASDPTTGGGKDDGATDGNGESGNAPHGKDAEAPEKPPTSPTNGDPTDPAKGDNDGGVNEDPGDDATAAGDDSDNDGAPKGGDPEKGSQGGNDNPDPKDQQNGSSGNGAGGDTEEKKRGKPEKGKKSNPENPDDGDEPHGEPNANSTGPAKASPNPAKGKEGEAPPGGVSDSPSGENAPVSQGSPPGAAPKTNPESEFNAGPGAQKAALVGMAALGFALLAGGFVLASKSSLCGLRRAADGQVYEAVSQQNPTDTNGALSTQENEIEADGWNDGWEQEDWDGGEISKA